VKPRSDTSRIGLAARTRLLPGLIAFALAALVLAAPAPGLVPAAHAQETQVPIDRAGKIERIDVRLAIRLGLFTDRYPGFQEARLFAAPDSSLTLEVTSVRGGKLVRERLPLSPAGADSLRDRVSALVAERAPDAGLNQEGRAALLGGVTSLGLGFFGWALPVAADVQDGQVFAGVYMLTAGASYFIPYAATASQPVSWGMSNLALYGATRGIWHGALLYQLALDTHDTERGILAAMVMASLAEGAAGYAWARHSDLSAGAATTIGNLGDLGLLNGLAVANLADYYENDRNASAATVMLLGSVAGVAGGRALAARRDYSYGDAVVMRDVTMLGVFAAEMATDWFDTADSKPFIAAAMAGSAAGLAAGDVLVRDTEFTTGQSTLVTLGTIAGGAIGLGLAFVASPGPNDNGTFMLTSSMIGSALGFTATYRSLLPQARRAHVDRTSWRVELSPLAFGGRLLPGPGDRGRGAAAGGAARPPLPLVRVQYRF
jgi:hypothetical protein